MIPSDVDVPYTPRAFAEAHPERLFVLASLWGMTPAPPKSARVLEIGCGSGGHLIPIAARYPEAECRGIDLDETEIETARNLAGRLGLTNVRFEAADLRAAGTLFASEPPFDFIVAHGMYSWIPADAREELMASFGRMLAERGVAYLSHNTLPGFHLREFLRDVLKVHVADERSARRQAAMARDVAEVLANAPVSGKRAPEMLRREIESLRQASDVRIVYDDLGPNEAFYFGDVVSHAERHGLSYLCDAVPGADVEDAFGGLGGQALKELGRDRLRYQEYLDFFMVRHFRRTLFCRQSAKLLPHRAPRAIRGLFAAARFGDAPDEARRIAKECAEAAGVEQEVVRSVLSVLAERWPEACAFGVVAERIERERSTMASSAPHGDSLETAVLALYDRGVVELFTEPPPAIREPGERPKAWPPARLSAELERPVPSLHLASVDLTEEQRTLLAQLDGSHSRVELSRKVEPSSPERVDRLLAELAARALLVG